jgi:hypothetical protein
VNDKTLEMLQREAWLDGVAQVLAILHTHFANYDVDRDGRVVAKKIAVAVNAKEMIIKYEP